GLGFHLFQAGHEIGMLRGVQTFLNDGKDAGQVMIPQRDRIEPETREDRAAIKAVCRESHRLVAPLAEHEPVDLAVEHAPDNVFADAVAAVNLELDAQIVTGTTRSDLGHKLGSTLEVIVIADPCLAAESGINDQASVWLRFVVQVQPNAAIVAGFDAGSASLILTQPGAWVNVWAAVATVTNGRWHVNDPFDQLGFLQVRHRL